MFCYYYFLIVVVAVFIFGVEYNSIACKNKLKLVSSSYNVNPNS